ncbi:MAG: TIGR03086 family metal-binding protein [Nocardioides sp.]|uniref:TIGR03086 family metal-binding protein n=1 Tax=Nocardioides sp. TaxID=35761 RepID=UPI002392C8CD|nr:TIGR03086 family metal-binding protein [Nocardioides sp.]MDE0778603.1 TIGR03086 family metal-binding protein [Nocardioides sp.]
MTAAPGVSDAVELLERSLSYTRVALSGISDDELGRPTPCTRWDLRDLLAHMDDALDAFTEGATGAVIGPVDAGAPAAVRTATLQRKACALVGVWSTALLGDLRETTSVGDATLDRSVLALAAAVEITVHGWDVGIATGRGRPIPEALAAELLPMAVGLVDEADRCGPGPHRFGAPLVPAVDASYGERLLAFLGRRPTPH